MAVYEKFKSYLIDTIWSKSSKLKKKKEEKKLRERKWKVKIQSDTYIKLFQFQGNEAPSDEQKTTYSNLARACSFLTTVLERHSTLVGPG